MNMKNKTNSAKTRAIIFDLDGTLWDATEEITTAWNMALKNHGIEMVLSVAQIRKEMGKLMEQIEEDIFPDFNKKQRDYLFKECLDCEYEYLKNHCARLYNGLEDVLKDISKDYFLAVVSNSQEGYVSTFLKVSGLSSYFDDYEEAGRTGKPKCDNIRLVMDRNNIQKAVYVGDTQSDMEAAALANVPFVYAEYGFGNITQSAYCLKDIRQLTTVVTGII